MLDVDADGDRTRDGVYNTSIFAHTAREIKHYGHALKLWCWRFPHVLERLFTLL